MKGYAKILLTKDRQAVGMKACFFAWLRMIRMFYNRKVPDSEFRFKRALGLFVSSPQLQENHILNWFISGIGYIKRLAWTFSKEMKPTTIEGKAVMEAPS